MIAKTNDRMEIGYTGRNIDEKSKLLYGNCFHDNDKMLVDKIQTAILNTIPVWKSQFVIAVGLNTQQKVNQNLISTIEETIQIQKEGSAKRQAAEVELNRIENELKNKLLEVRR